MENKPFYIFLFWQELLDDGDVVAKLIMSKVYPRFSIWDSLIYYILLPGPGLEGEL